ncbi:MAG: hypothetical protein WDM85_00575 [Caulobacteraceae bacterium]
MASIKALIFPSTTPSVSERSEGVLGDLDAVLFLDGEDDADEVDGIQTDILQLGGWIELGPVPSAPPRR